MQTNSHPPASSGQQPLDPLHFVESIGPKAARRERLYEKAIDGTLATLTEVATATEILGANPDLRKKFFERFKAKTGSNKKAHRLVQSLVTYTMGLQGPRSQAYARVIEIARASGIKPSDLPAWVKKEGGIEAIRRNRKPGDKSSDLARNVRAQCEEALSVAPSLATIASLPTPLHSSVDNEHSFVVTILRHDPKTSTGDILWGSADDALVGQFLLKVSKDVCSKHGAQATAKGRASQLDQAEAAIEAALDALARGDDAPKAA